MVHCAAYDCLMVVGRPKAFYKFQADNQRRKQAVTTNDLRASFSKPGVEDHSKLHRSELRSDAVPTT